MNILLQCTQTVHDENIVCEVTYILTESIRCDCAYGKAYGFIIEEYCQKCGGGNRRIVQEAIDVFEDYETARYFFEILVREKVLPTTLIYHIDDWNSAFHPNYIC